MDAVWLRYCVFSMYCSNVSENCIQQQLRQNGYLGKQGQKTSRQGHTGALIKLLVLRRHWQLLLLVFKGSIKRRSHMVLRAKQNHIPGTS